MVKNHSIAATIPNNIEKLNIFNRCSRFNMIAPETTSARNNPLLKAPVKLFLRPIRTSVPKPQVDTKREQKNRNFMNLVA